MKLSESWLRELVDVDGSTDDLVKQLNRLGLEVDTVAAAAPAFNGVVVAKVISVEAHPEADKLKLCQVDAGNGDTVQIVCGANNVVADSLFALATVGAVLPGGINIKKAKLRGAESFGMLCSERELGLSEHADGLMVLPAGLSVGEDLRTALDLDDQLIEVDLTPNRGDCLSVLGIAREIAAAQNRTLKFQPSAAVQATSAATFPIEIQASEACPRYVGRVVKGINPTAQTPFWMREKLRRGGVRTIHPVVDIANYVMLEIGQPMHAFDLDKLSDGIIVRMARAGEPMRLLDDSEVELQDNSLVIADHKAPCALAGIMGGADSAVSEQTRDILFESAFFAPKIIAGRARQYGLHTDSSHRFERGVDPELQALAVERATELLLQIAAGEAGPVLDIGDTTYQPKPHTIELRSHSIQRVLGIRLQAAQVEQHLQALQMDVERSGDESWRVTPPSYRFDMALEADLIEELARLHGYEHFPRTIPSHCPSIRLGAIDASVTLDFDSILVLRGYQEIISYSFVDPELQRLLDSEIAPLALKNPISSEMSVMRTNLLPGLINCLKYNLNRQQKDLKIYEKGLRFIPQATNIKQENVISGLRYGTRNKVFWEGKSEAVDFYDVKGDVEALLAPHDLHRFRFEPFKHPALHPGQAACVLMEGEVIGYLGTLHPKITQPLSLDEPVYLFELQTTLLRGAGTAQFEPISKFTQNRRDLAIVVDDSVTWAHVEQAIRAEAPEFLQDVQLFDVYAGKGVISGRKSFAIGLILQEISRTLTDKEIDDTVNHILAVLSKNLGATLRE